jgi:hypothetical protein
LCSSLALWIARAVNCLQQRFPCSPSPNFLIVIDADGVGSLVPSSISPCHLFKTSQDSVLALCSNFSLGVQASVYVFSKQFLRVNPRCFPCQKHQQKFGRVSCPCHPVYKVAHSTWKPIHQLVKKHAIGHVGLYLIHFYVVLLYHHTVAVGAISVKIFFIMLLILRAWMRFEALYYRQLSDSTVFTVRGCALYLRKIIDFTAPLVLAQLTFFPNNKSVKPRGSFQKEQ